MLGPPQAPYAAIEGQCSREGEPTRVAPVAVVLYVQKMCIKAAARSQATLGARLVLQKTYQAAISLHRRAFWDMLERLMTQVRRRKALNRWHQTARAGNTERASIVARQMMRETSQQLRIDSIRLRRRFDRPGKFTIRRLTTGEEFHIAANGIRTSKDLYDKVREVLDLQIDVRARLVDIDNSGLFTMDSQDGLPESDEESIGGKLPGSLLGLVLLQFRVWVRLPDGEVRDIICHMDPNPIARELHPPEISMHDIYACVRQALDLKPGLSLALYKVIGEGTKSEHPLSASWRTPAKSLDGQEIYAVSHP